MGNGAYTFEVTDSSAEFVVGSVASGNDATTARRERDEPEGSFSAEGFAQPLDMRGRPLHEEHPGSQPSKLR